MCKQAGRENAQTTTFWLCRNKQATTPIILRKNILETWCESELFLRLTELWVDPTWMKIWRSDLSFPVMAMDRQTNRLDYNNFATPLQLGEIVREITWNILEQTQVYGVWE